MKILTIHGGNFEINSILNKTLRKVYNKLEGKGIELDNILLKSDQVKIYNKNEDSSFIKQTMKKIENSEGLIILTPLDNLGISTIMKMFLDYFNDSKYENHLEGKYVYIIVQSKNEVYVSLLKDFFKKKGSIELDVININNESELMDKKLENSLEIFKGLHTKKKNFSLFKNNNIDELTQIFEKKLEEEKDKEEKEKNETDNDNEIETKSKEVEVEYKSGLEEKTAHAVKKLKEEIGANIQVDIKNSFSGYIIGKGEHIRYKSGKLMDPDITIIASEKEWNNILDGKIVIKKAFMTGKIKVKGNFMLLSKLSEIA